jgi:hypothetical protein
MEKLDRYDRVTYPKATVARTVAFSCSVPMSHQNMCNYRAKRAPNQSFRASPAAVIRSSRDIRGMDLTVGTSRLCVLLKLRGARWSG